MPVRCAATTTSPEQLLELSVMLRAIAIDRKDAATMLRQLASLYEFGAIIQQMRDPGA